MKCASCKLSFSCGVQCSTCKKFLDFECAQITETRFRNLGSKRSAWKCVSCRPSPIPSPVLSPIQSPVPPQDPATLEIVLKEIQDIKSQLSCVPCIVADIKTIKQKISGEFTKTFTDFKNKVTSLEAKVSENTHKHFESKLNYLQSEVALFKSRVSSVQRSTSVRSRGVPTKEVENLFSPRNSVCNKKVIFPF